jgi:hypothetical protein
MTIAVILAAAGPVTVVIACAAAWVLGRVLPLGWKYGRPSRVSVTAVVMRPIPRNVIQPGPSRVTTRSSGERAPHDQQ